ncbi:MAG: GNAT family N-acetyltransferase [Chloroflexota bacterium]
MHKVSVENRELSLKPITDHDINQTITLLNRGFTGYTVNIHFDRHLFYHILKADGIDLNHSRIVLCDGEPAAIALIATRGWTSRLATMAIVPERRGQGIGTWFMQQLIADARVREEQQMALEVIASNRPAVRLYQRCGFETRRRLLSYRLAQQPAPQPAPPKNVVFEEVDLRLLAHTIIQHGLSDLPWQISGESLAQTGPPHRAYHWQGCTIGLSDPSKETINIRSIVVEPQQRGQSIATAALTAIIAQYPNKEWRISAHCPEELRGLFERVGFVEEPLSQLQMFRVLV